MSNATLLLPDTDTDTAPVSTPDGDCWYLDPGHRPSIGWCPRRCNGPPTHSERAATGDQLLYCEAHAYWRRKTIRVAAVRRLRPNEQQRRPS
jgi:hypothetical protein